SSQPIENSLKRIYLPVKVEELVGKMINEYNFIEVGKNELVWNDLIRMKINDINGMCCVTFRKVKGTLEEYENALRDFICELKQ
ncbi:CAMK CAMKL kinase, partial [Tubulinosema ratisbonensis]